MQADIARLVVALKLEADLLTFDEFAHAGALNGGDVDERIGAAIVRLNEAEALGGNTRPGFGFLMFHTQ